MYAAVPRRMDRSARRFHAWTGSVKPNAANEDQNRPGSPEYPTTVYTTSTVITPTGMSTARKSMNGLAL